jgi:hypothetical protein
VITEANWTKGHSFFLSKGLGFGQNAGEGDKFGFLCEAANLLLAKVARGVPPSLFEQSATQMHANRFDWFLFILVLGNYSGYPSTICWG